MSLHIRQHVFTWGDKFTVWDDMGNERFFVSGEVFSFGKKLHVYDAQMNEIAYIEQKLFSFMPKYTIYFGSMSALVRQQFTFLRREYTVEGPEWRISGDFLEHDYVITAPSGDEIGSVYREWLTFGDCYTINYINIDDEILMLCTALAVDASIERND